MFQYQLLADQLTQKIHKGELKQNQRLLSLRDFAAQQSISLTTAKSCYELLESRGLLYTKHRSGYYVKVHQANSNIPDSPDFPSIPRKISNLQLLNEIQEVSIRSDGVRLGAVQLDPVFVPVDDLRRCVSRAMKYAKAEDFLYCNRQGHLTLRQALVEHWREDGIYIDLQDVFISNGCLAAVTQVLQQLSKENDTIIVPTPTFNGQLQLLANLNRKIIEIPSDHQGIDLKRLEQVMQMGIVKVCLLTANFQNPLGYCLTNEHKAHIAMLAEKYRCFIIEDDIYAECGFTSTRPLPIKYWDKAGYVIWCGSVSKSLSSAYRIGWYCLGQQVAALREKLLAQNTLVSTPLQLGLADLIHSRAYRKHLDRLHHKLFDQVLAYTDYIRMSFKDIAIAISQPQGGYFLWIELPDCIDSLRLYQDMKLKHIHIVPGLIFGEDERYRHFIRLNIGHQLSKDIQQAIDDLATWCKIQLSHL